MSLHSRIRKIREYRGLKQATAAQQMNITQQAYSYLESKSDNLKMETMQRFCEVMKVEIPFLLAFDVPVTEENIQLFERLNLSGVVEEYKKLQNRISVYEELLNRQNNVHRGNDTSTNLQIS